MISVGCLCRDAGMNDAYARSVIYSIRVLVLLASVLVFGGCLGEADDIRWDEPGSVSETAVDEWPSCEQRPSGQRDSRIADVWAADPTEPAPVWLPGVYVSGMSGGGCAVGKECLLFVQQQASYQDLDAAVGQSLRLAVSADVSGLFTQISVGDRVDLFASAWRSSSHGELRLAIDIERPGCANVRGTGEVVPVEVELSDLSIYAYEQLLGPLLVELRDVVGVPKAPYKTFSLKEHDEDEEPVQDFSEVTNVSPYFLSNGKFVGLDTGQPVSFESVTGVFALYTPQGGARKYEHIYVRGMDDLRY